MHQHALVRPTESAINALAKKVLYQFKNHPAYHPRCFFRRT